MDRWNGTHIKLWRMAKDEINTGVKAREKDKGF